MDWMKIVEHLGFPAAALAALAWAAWRAGVFLGKDVALPLAQRHIVFLDKVEVCLASNTESTKALQEAVTTLKESQDKQNEALEQQNEALATICRFRPACQFPGHDTEHKETA